MQDRAAPIEETLRALDDLVRAGKVRYIGCSNYIGARLVESLWAADRRNLTPFASIQMQWSLAVRDAEREKGSGKADDDEQVGDEAAQRAVAVARNEVQEPRAEGASPWSCWVSARDVALVHCLCGVIVRCPLGAYDTSATW